MQCYSQPFHQYRYLFLPWFQDSQSWHHGLVLQGGCHHFICHVLWLACFFFDKHYMNLHWFTDLTVTQHRTWFHERDCILRANLQFFLLPSIFEMFFFNTSDKCLGPFKGHCGSHLVWSWEQGLGPKTCSMDRCKKSFGLPVASQPTLSYITNLGLWLREDNTKQRFIIKKMLFLFTCLTFVFAQKKLHEYSENDSFFTIFLNFWNGKSGIFACGQELKKKKHNCQGW